MAEITLTVRLVVLDEERLRAHAVEQYRKVWHDEEWTPESPGEAAFEALIGSSNDTISPDEMGIELHDFRWSDAPAYEGAR